jgi:hypothetical protein
VRKAPTPLQILGIWPRSPEQQREHERIPYALMRGARLRTDAAIGKALSHNLRMTQVPNADPARPIDIRVGADTVDGVKRAIRKRLAETKPIARGQPIRALHLVCAMPNRSWYEREAAADYTRVEALKRTMEAWVERQFGAEQVVSLVWHYDEESPHLHSVVLPLERRLDTGGRPPKDLAKAKPPRERWCYAGSRWFGAREQTKEVLALRQDSFADAVSDWGLVRGERGSTAKHVDGPARMDLLRRGAGELGEAQRLQAESVAAWAHDTEARRSAIIATAEQQAAEIVAKATEQARARLAEIDARMADELDRRTAAVHERLHAEADAREKAAETRRRERLAEADKVVAAAQATANAAADLLEAAEASRRIYHDGAVAFRDLLDELRVHKENMPAHLHEGVAGVADRAREQVRRAAAARQRQQEAEAAAAQRRADYEAAARVAHTRRNSQWVRDPAERSS